MTASASLVLIALASLFLIGGTVVTIMFLDVVFRGPDRMVRDREKEARRWRPPYASGGLLVEWAQGMASRKVRWRLAGEQAEAAPSELLAEIHAGADQAMLPDVGPREVLRRVPCPSVGQGTIGISAPEAIGIADFIRYHLPPGDRDRIRALARENVTALESAAVGPQPEAPCPLQGESCVCVTYAARPLQCRPFHAATIADHLGLHPSQPDRVSRWEAHVREVAQGIRQGLTEGIESAGLDANLYELNSALLAVLDRPDVAKRWLGGEDVFSGCARYPELGPRRTEPVQ